MTTWLEPTEILNYRSPIVQIFARKVDEMAAVRTLPVLAAARTLVNELIQPTHSVRDLRKVSRTLSRGVGSLNQRLAIVEAVARSRGIPQRTRGLLVPADFPAGVRFAPEAVVLAWPEFEVDGEWVSDPLEGAVLHELGTFVSRDALFDQHPPRGSWLTEVMLASKS